MAVPRELITDFDSGWQRLHDLAKELGAKLDPSAIFLEIGTRSGDSAIATLSAIRDTRLRWFITVDPYGQKPYQMGDAVSSSGMDYGEQHYRNAMYSLSKFAFDNDLLHWHWRMTSDDFMKFWPQIDFWFENAQPDKQFGLVFLDGMHDKETVGREFAWFKERLVPGGAIVIDDASLLQDTDFLGNLATETIDNRIYFLS